MYWKTKQLKNDITQRQNPCVTRRNKKMIFRCDEVIKIQGKQEIKMTSLFSK